MLRTKHRFLILITISLSIAAASLVNQIAVYLNINPQDPLLFDRQNTAYFYYDDGFNENNITLTVFQVEPNWSNVSLLVGSTQHYIAVNHEGFYNFSNRNTIFWLHVPNPLTSEAYGIIPGTVYNVTDTIGLIGPPGSNYTGIVTDKFVYWPNDPGVHGAQYAFVVTFRNATNNAVMGIGTYDSTCGMLFTLEGGIPFIQVRLLETSYEISRNRMMSWPWALGLSTGITVIAYVYMKKKTELDTETITEITLLMTAGVAAIMVDIYVDVWLYALFDFMGNILLHLGVAIGLAIICFYQRYKLKWTIPAFLEVAFLIPMVYFMGDPYVPLMTAFMGLVITWIVMIFISGHPKQPESKTKIGKLISEFV